MDIAGPTREDLLREQRDVISSRFLNLEVEMGMLRVEHDRTRAELNGIREEREALAARLAELAQSIERRDNEEG